MVDKTTIVADWGKSIFLKHRLGFSKLLNGAGHVTKVLPIFVTVGRRSDGLTKLRFLISKRFQGKPIDASNIRSQV